MIIAILFTFISLDHTLVNQSAQASRNKNYLQSETILAGVQTKNETYYVQKMINAHSLNRKKETARCVEILETHFHERLPERHKVLTHLIKEDLKLWDKDDLGDIARDMRQVQDNLHNADHITRTKKLQKEIIDRLDKMIKEKEDQLANANSLPEGDGDGNGDAARRIAEATPLPDSGIHNNGGKGEVDNKKIKKNTGLYKSMTMEREMEQRFQRITPSFSPRHRLAIEAYYRKIAEASLKK